MRIEQISRLIRPFALSCIDTSYRVITPLLSSLPIPSNIFRWRKEMLLGRIGRERKNGCVVEGVIEDSPLHRSFEKHRGDHSSADVSVDGRAIGAESQKTDDDDDDGEAFSEIWLDRSIHPSVDRSRRRWEPHRRRVYRCLAGCLHRNCRTAARGVSIRQIRRKRARGDFVKIPGAFMSTVD